MYEDPVVYCVYEDPVVYWVYEDPVVYWVYEDHVERLDGIGLEFNSKPEG